jgi:sterol 3beta-glucosyltransferase
MKVLIFAYGSRGDVQPFVALSHALNDAGHTAVLAAPAKFAGLAAEYGVEYFPRNEDLVDFFVNDPDVSTWLNRDNGQVTAASRQLRKKVYGKLIAEFRRCFPIMLGELADAAADGADVVVQAYGGWPYEQGHHVAERLGVPAVLSTLYPNYLPSFHYPAKFVPADRDYPKLVRRLSHVPRRAQQSIGRKSVARWRSETLGLPPRRGMHNRLRRPDGGAVPMLQCFSPELVPPAPDWPPSVFTTGFWHVPERSDFTPPPPLASFLADGPPPICVSLGTVRGEDPDKMGRMVTEAVRLAGVRAVIVRAGGSLEVADSDPRCVVVDEVPYWWLFPRTSVVVHAGGVGTSNEALRAGLPEVSVPVSNEQLMWGVLLHRAGVAPPPLRNRTVTATSLADAIRSAHHEPGLRARATELAARVRTEHGTQAAVRILETVQQNPVGFVEKAAVRR